MSDANREEVWLLPSEIGRRLGLPSQAVLRLMDTGKLSVLRLPNQRPRLRLHDVQRLLEASTTSATQEA